MHLFEEENGKMVLPNISVTKV